MELNEKPLGAGGTAPVSAAKQTNMSTEVLAARMCEMSADMSNVVRAMNVMVQLQRDAIPIQQSMLAHMAKAQEDNAHLSSQIDKLVRSYEEASAKQDAVVEGIGRMEGELGSLSKNIMSMLTAAELNMGHLSMTTATVVTSGITPRKRYKTRTIDKDGNEILTDESMDGEFWEDEFFYFLRIIKNSQDFAAYIESERLKAKVNV